MHTPVDLTRGGYKGDTTEEAFKSDTSKALSYWWHFREVLRASHTRNPNWVRLDGTPLDDEGQQKLVALSLLNYAAYTGFAGAIAARDGLVSMLNGPRESHLRLPFELRRRWKEAYGSLYSSFAALLNLVCILSEPSQPLIKGDKVTTYNFDDRVKNSLTTKGGGLARARIALEQVHACLEIRTQLDHYWLIWTELRPEGLFMDGSFGKKGHIPLDGPSSCNVNVVARLSQDINATAGNFDSVYRELAVTDGYLDQLFTKNNWQVRYDDYGLPHNGARPRP
ncbi:unnamed protein product [Gemmata massiliana]|uniref:Uncharacterized protein n=1 Tax=Gemmata massiliana TaxID=1210884 RepID=A0A6P2CR65_9BACT|nr:hypothetical protein [Gemmata massiliana]VTR91558.1 unnamed protein product [Gemmata massiliana]